MKKKIDLKKIIRIEVVEKPLTYESGSGLYDVRIGDSPNDILYHDIISLKKWLDEIWAEKSDRILDMLQNFNAVILNLQSGEITISLQVLS